MLVASEDSSMDSESPASIQPTEAVWTTGPITASPWARIVGFKATSLCFRLRRGLRQIYRLGWLGATCTICTLFVHLTPYHAGTTRKGPSMPTPDLNLLVTLDVLL